MSQFHGNASLEITARDATHATAVFRGRTDLSLRMDGCEIVANDITCAHGLDGTRVEVVGLSAGDVLLTHLGEDGALLTAEAPIGTMKTSLVAHPFPFGVLAMAMLVVAIFLARPRAVSVPRIALAYALGGAGVWLLLVRLTGS